MATVTYPLVLVLISYLCFGCVYCNAPPLVTFGPSGGNVFWNEDTPIGTTLFALSAVDSDSQTITFTATNTETKSLVNISQPTKPSPNTWEVNVTLIAPLDRDRSPNTRDLLFDVSDGASKISGRVKLIIRDVNDNPPLFVNLPYRLSLPEGTEYVNTTVFVAATTDPDDGPGRLAEYSMAAQAQGADEAYNKTFVILDPAHGNITLAMELDYETRNYYQYQIFAKDRGIDPCPGPTCHCNNVSEPNVVCEGEPATFIVIITDVQDTPPYFERLPYLASVKENAAVGTSFYQVSALDGDRGDPNEVTYSIVNDTNYPFTIDSQTGDLKVGSPGLDADQPNGQRYDVTVMATEVSRPGKSTGGENTTTTLMSITVNDINDNSPQFKDSVYYATVLENTPRGVPLTFNATIEVSDRDQSTNSQFELSVEKDGAAYAVFSTLPPPGTLIQSKTTVMVSVFDSSVLDYEVTKSLTFQLKATEKSTSELFSNTTTVILTIEDMNDNSPVFGENQTTTVNVTEAAAAGTVLGTFTATDDDSGDYGTVSYFLEDTLNGKFAIDDRTGNLSVQADLDREEPGGAAYSLVVIATDNIAGDEAQRRSTRLNVRVTVLDVNDNPPVFQPHPDSVTVQENASPNTALMTLTATDKDEGLNGEVFYQVLDIRPQNDHLPQPIEQLIGVHADSGIVFVNASLIGHPGAFNVTFVAYDSAEEPNNATTLLVVYVRDVNINAPRFIVPDQDLVNTSAKLVPNITVDEEQPIGSFILQLNATDIDTGANGMVFYFVEPDLAGYFNSFSVLYSDGTLTNKIKLDREKQDMLQINLKAEDQGSPTKLSSVIPFRVYLRDIDDNDPMFPPPATLSLSVGEELKAVRVGFVNVSTDADQDPQNKITCYYIFGGDRLDIFTLSKTDGELRLESELDRDVTQSVTLVVKAASNCSLTADHFITNGSNSYNSSDNSLLKVLVTVEDINDNPPVFVKDALTVGLIYDEDVNSQVIDLVTYTQDNDTAIHSRNMYRLLSTTVHGEVAQPPPVPFSVSTNGSVVTNRLFQSDEKGYFVLTVMAYDVDNQTDTADLTIYLVGDRQRVKLVFNKQPNFVQSIKGDLIKKLSEALGMTIIADKIASHIAAGGNADPDRTDVFIHGRYIPSGEIVPPGELLRAFDYNEKVREIFQEFGATETLQVWQEKDEGDNEEMKRAFIIVAIVLAIVCMVLLFVLVNTIRRYRRRLRAATTSAFVSQKEEPNGYIPPGTNKYFAAENPLFGKDVKPGDPERHGDNDSLDDNAVDGLKASQGGKDKEEEQEMYLELYDEGNESGMHVNHLAMVLQEYERDNVDGGEEGGPGGGYTNSAFVMSEGGPDKWRSSLNGHVKSDSGFNEHDEPYESAGGMRNLQYTDI